MIETPRVISGYILDDYMRLAALSELNFHFVSSHFQHPDDVLDEDRGAALGWEVMFGNLSDYVEWLFKAAPGLRRLTGTEMAAAVQQYDRLSIRREQEGNVIRLSLGGFGEEAWLLVRFNEGQPGKVTGGSLEKVTEGLYLLDAKKDRIEIEVVK